MENDFIFLSTFFDPTSVSGIGKPLMILIIAGFMPLAAISYFLFMMDKKEKEYAKATNEMGINSSRKVRDSMGPMKYVFPVGFVTLICLIAITTFMYADQYMDSVEDSLLLTSSYFGDGNKNLMNQSLSVLMMAFLGGFLWSAQNIIRRLIAYDLSPSVFYSAGIRILFACVIALVLSFVMGSANENFLNFRSALPAVAFLTGMFPSRVLDYLVNRYKNYINGENVNTKYLSLDNIEGISVQHKERLVEIGIDNAQNLAMASLTELLINTPFGARQLLDWIGQAKLLVYVKNDIEKLRQVGIRSVFDLYKGQKSREALMEISYSVGLNSPMLQVVRDQVIEDQGIGVLYQFMQRLNSPNPAPVPYTTGSVTAENIPLPDTPMPSQR